MQRRKFLLGASSAAIGASALVGSGAYSAMTAQRTATVNVVADDNSLVGMSPGLDSDTVKLSDNPGELVVDTSLDGSTGVNNGSTYLFGEFENIDPLDEFSPQEFFDDTAFVVWIGSHWSGESVQKTEGAISFLSPPELQPVGSPEGGDESVGTLEAEESQWIPPVSNDEYAFHISNNDTATHDFELTVPAGELGGLDGDGPSPRRTLSFEGVSPGDYIAVMFVVIAGEGTADSSLSGQLSVSATDGSGTPEPTEIPQ